MTTKPIQLLGMVAQSLQKREPGWQRTPQDLDPYIHWVRFERVVRGISFLSHTPAKSLFAKNGIFVPHPAPTTLPSIARRREKRKREGQAPLLKSGPFSRTGGNPAQYLNSTTTTLVELDFEILKSKDNYRSNNSLATLKLPNPSLLDFGNIKLTDAEIIVPGLEL